MKCGETQLLTSQTFVEGQIRRLQMLLVTFRRVLAWKLARIKDLNPVPVDGNLIAFVVCKIPNNSLLRINHGMLAEPNGPQTTRKKHAFSHRLPFGH